MQLNRFAIFLRIYIYSHVIFSSAMGNFGFFSAEISQLILKTNRYLLFPSVAWNKRFNNDALIIINGTSITKIIFFLFANNNVNYRQWRLCTVMIT